MKIHEYQAKALLSAYGVTVPDGKLAETPDQAARVASDFGGNVVVKAQIHAGGRGKAGGIKIATDAQSARQAAAELLGSRLVTHQTSPSGAPVAKVLVEKTVTTQRELYLSIVVDRIARMPVMLASEAGGMDIEAVAQKSPELILRTPIDPATGFRPFQARKLTYGLKLTHEQAAKAAVLMENLYRLFVEKDCSLVEINPLVVTAGNDIVALDAKLDFDDSALFRHEEIRKLQDPDQDDPLEAMAAEHGIKNYVKLRGNIGCIVNGAGLAMAVLDLIAIEGGKPANFLDLGTATNTNIVVNSFRVIASDTHVKVILVNIFAGISRVDIVANGILESYRTMNIKVPLVMRLAGTNVAEGKRILAESGLKYTEATDLSDAVRKAVAIAR
jgi:succinyl-CoA synthetase beta subunit